MNEPIRMLHFADAHIGVETHGITDPATGVNSRIADFLARLDELIDYGLAHDVDLVIFAGDAYHKRHPDPVHQHALAQRIKRLSDAAVPTLMVKGNHDTPAATSTGAVDVFAALDVPHVIVADRPALHTVQTKRGAVQVGAVPYPVMQRLMSVEALRRAKMETLVDVAQKAIASNIEDMEMALRGGSPAVLVGHLTVSGAVFGSEQSVMLGWDAVVQRAVLEDSAWSYVALGHLHKHQSLGAGRPIVYPGSIERVDFGEEREDKGFCWVELDGPDATWEFVPLAARPFLTIRADVRGEEQPMEALESVVRQHDLEGAIVRVIVQADAEQRPHMPTGAVRSLLTGAHNVASVRFDVTRPARARFAGQDLSRATDLDLLKRYMEVSGVTAERAETLVNMAAPILEAP